MVNVKAVSKSIRKMAGFLSENNSVFFLVEEA